MGVCECESGHHHKTLIPESQNSYPIKNIPNSNKEILHEQMIDSKQKNQTEIGINNSLNQQIEKNKCPELDKYERSMFISGKKSEFSQFNNKTVSVFSAEKTEEEVIVKGEINKECKNKEEDFVNNSFKNLIKDNGGIVIKNDDLSSFVCSNSGIKPIFNIGSEAISEIKSKHTLPVYNFQYNDYKYGLKNDNRSTNLKLIRNNLSEKQKSILTYNKKNLRESSKINLTFNDNCPQVDSFINIPKRDEPLPDIDDLSTESPIPI
jgi:hypothetical protein